MNQSNKHKRLNLESTEVRGGERERGRKKLEIRRFVVTFILSVVILSVLRIGRRRVGDTSVLKERGHERVAHRTKGSKVGDVLGADRFGR
jgi:hypothetical protein